MIDKLNRLTYAAEIRLPYLICVNPLEREYPALAFNLSDAEKARQLLDSSHKETLKIINDMVSL